MFGIFYCFTFIFKFNIWLHEKEERKKKRMEEHRNKEISKWMNKEVKKRPL